MVTYIFRGRLLPQRCATFANADTADKSSVAIKIVLPRICQAVIWNIQRYSLLRKQFGAKGATDRAPAIAAFMGWILKGTGRIAHSA